MRPTQELCGRPGWPGPSPSEGSGRVSEERPAAAASGHCPAPPRPAPGHLPGDGRRRALPVLAPPVQPRRGERTQPGGHGVVEGRPAGGPRPRRAEAAERRAATGARLRDGAAGVQGAPLPHRLCTGAHVTHCDLQRAAESSPNRKDIVHTAGAAQ